MNSNRTLIIWAAASSLGASLLLAAPARADVPNEPPSVSITSPTDGQMFDGPAATIDVVLDAFAGDEGISSVRLLVDDAPVLTDNEMPWGFEGVEISEGMHTLVAVVVSSVDGDEFASDPVEVVVLAAAGETSAGETTASETTTSETTTGDTAGSTKGCSVGAGTQVGAGLVLMCLLGLSFVGRRRED